MSDEHELSEEDREAIQRDEERWEATIGYYEDYENDEQD